MKKLSRIFAITFALFFAASYVKSADVRLEEGTPVRLRLKQTISSADAMVNDRVYLEALEDTKINGIVAIPSGSLAVATVTEAEHKKRLGRGGKLAITLDFVRLPNGEKCMLSAGKKTKSGNHYGRQTGEMVAAGVLFWPAAPLFLLQHGKDMKILAGTEITAYITSDTSLNGENLRPKSNSSEIDRTIPQVQAKANLNKGKSQSPAARNAQSDLEREEAQFHSAFGVR